MWPRLRGAGKTCGFITKPQYLTIAVQPRLHIRTSTTSGISTAVMGDNIMSYFQGNDFQCHVANDFLGFIMITTKAPHQIPA